MAKSFRYKSELTVSRENAPGKNYLGVLLSILVLIIISSVIVAAIVIISPDIVSITTRPYIPREAITLEEVTLNQLAPNSLVYQWLPAQHREAYDDLFFEDYKNLNIISLQHSFDQINKNSGTPIEPTVINLVSNTSLISSIDYQGYKISPSRRYLLIWTTKEKQFRYSFTAKYFIYDIKLDLISLLSTKSIQNGGQSSQNYYEQLDTAAQYLYEQDVGDEYSRFQLVDWFTGNVNQDSLVLIQNNDIYLLDNVAFDENSSSKKHQSAPVRLTHTGKTGIVFNGVPDWLYEEEIISDSRTFEVSPLGTGLAYMSINDSLVDEFPLPSYGPNEQIIPEVRRIRYPKTGRVNPQVSVYVVDNLMNNNRINVEVALPDDFGQRQHYINRIKWLTDDKLALVWVNRSQNETYYLICSRQTGWRCEKSFHMTVSGGWLESIDQLTPVSDEHYLALLYKDEGPDVGAFKHIGKISLENPNNYTFLTSGRREVVSIVGVDAKRSLVYYMATVENQPGQRQIFWTHLSSSDDQGGCLTCDHYPDECLYNNAKLSPSGNYYMFECEGPGVPRTELRAIKSRESFLGERLPRLFEETSTALTWPLNLTNSSTLLTKGYKDDRTLSPTSNLIWTAVDNQELRDRLNNNKAMPLTMRLKVPIANTNYTANVIMLLPPQLGAKTIFKSAPAFAASGRSRPPRSAARAQSGIEQPIHAHYSPDTISEYTSHLLSGQQYPMVVDVYGGPGSQKVDYRFSMSFAHYMVSSRRTIYVMIDGRGSGYQGTKRLFELYHKFGTVEIEDQIEVADYLTRNFSFIDSTKVAIWGWSYGGYAAAMALARSSSRLSTLRSQVNEFAGNSSLNRTATQDTMKTAPTSLAPFNGVFECAASVAPVTNWIYYDTAYTERYMSSPYPNERYDILQSGDHDQFSRVLKNHDTHAGLTNEWLPLNKSVGLGIRSSTTRLGDATSLSNLNKRYEQASLLNHIGKIDKKRFLLIHGTADDNVHFQQSVMLMKKLIQKNILFGTRIYPDQDHGIASKADRLHLGATLSTFFAECFDRVY